MKVINSLKSAKLRDKNNIIVKRRNKIFIINKKKPKLKTRQG